MKKFLLPLIAAVALCGCTTQPATTTTSTGTGLSGLLTGAESGLTGIENLFGNQDETGGGSNGPVGNTNPTNSPVSDTGNSTLLDDQQDPQTGDDGDPDVDDG